MRGWLRRRRDEPFMPRKEVYWLGNYCECGAPLLSDPKIEKHADYCGKARPSDSFKTRIQTKEPA
jgi:hypothetical protein